MAVKCLPQKGKVYYRLETYKSVKCLPQKKKSILQA